MRENFDNLDVDLFCCNTGSLRREREESRENSIYMIGSSYKPIFTTSKLEYNGDFWGSWTRKARLADFFYFIFFIFPRKLPSFDMFHP